MPTADLDIDTRSRRAVGYSLYLAAAVLFSINGTVSKILLTAIGDAARLAQMRVTSAFLIMLIIVALTRPSALRLRRSQILPLAAFGVLGVAMTQWLYFVAIARMPIGVALLIEFTAPIAVALWVRIVRRQRVRRTLWLGLALAMLGLALVAEVWNGFVLDSIGVAAAFGAAAALATYYLLGESLGSSHDPVSLTMWGFGFAAAMWAVVKPWWSFPFGSLGGSVPLDQASPFGASPVPLWLLATSMVILGTVVPFWLVVASIGHIGATGASVIGMTEPFIASLIAWLVLNETMAPVQILGGAIVLAGVAVAESARAAVAPLAP